MLAHQRRTGAFPQIRFRGNLFILVCDAKNVGQLLVMSESYFPRNRNGHKRLMVWWQSGRHRYRS
jgi:hypothetical protein